MSKASAITLISFFLVPGAVMGQNPTKMEALYKDINTAAMAGKADVYILGKKIVSDSLTISNQPVSTIRQKKKRKFWIKQ